MLLMTGNKMLSLLCVSLLLSVRCVAQVTSPVSISSPDRTTSCQVGLSGQGELMYRMQYEGQAVTEWSPMGLVVNGSSLAKQAGIVAATRKTYNERFRWPLGEDDMIINRCNELLLKCRSASRPFEVIVRAYNGSIAFRYRIAAGTHALINTENTAFNFTAPCILYQYNQESVFMPTALDTFSHTCDLPATLTNGKLYISLGEAVNTSYTKAELKKGAAANSLAVAFIRDSVVSCKGDYFTPWRTISVSRTAAGMHRFSQLFIQLAPPPATGRTPAWVRPGKLIRSQLTTRSGLDCIDFAATHQFQYIMFDAGWYGAEFRTKSDPTQPIPEIDMPKVISYGKKKGIGVILYVNYVGLRAKLDTILPLYRKWGVSGLKFGFVDGLTQKGISWLAEAIRKVNNYGFILDIHDNYKPTGLSRTFPALLTQEGIRGDENSPDAFHTTVLPFTRFLAGPADFTFCFPNPSNSFSKNIRVSKAQQLALTVIYFSPLQSIFWYGKPGDYTNEDEIEFFKYVPTVWNESRYLAGDIGKNISVARRREDAWFIGNAAGPGDWQDSLKLDFLAKGKAYTATIYEDDDKGGISKRMISVKKDGQLPFVIRAKGGQAMIIAPRK